MIFFSGFSSISHLMLIALEYFMLIRGAGWLNCKQGEEQTRKKGKNSAKVQNNIHLLPRMSGYRKKANHFFIWSLEEHMISCLRFPPFNFLLINDPENWICFCRRYKLQSVEVQGMGEVPWGAQELFDWASFPIETCEELWDQSRLAIMLYY